MTTPQELRKKAEQYQKTRKLAAKKALEIVNQARKIKGYEPISEEEYNKKRELREAKKNISATETFKIKEKKVEPIVIKNMSEENIMHMEQANKIAEDAFLLGPKKVVVSSIRSDLEDTNDQPAFSYSSHTELKENPDIDIFLGEKMQKSYEKMRSDKYKAYLENSWKTHYPFTNHRVQVIADEPRVAVTSDYINTTFKFSISERNNRIKEDPDLPKVFSSKKEGETNGYYYYRMVKEEEIRSEYIKKKNKEFDELEKKINEVMYPVEIVVTDENEEFCINAFELADNLAITELEKDPNFSLNQNTELYNKTYDKYIKLISSFKLEKNV